MVSFIIVNYNGEKYLDRCIGCLLNQKVEKEIIVVDNGSTDGSREIIKKFPVKYIFLDTNEGYAKGINMGVRASKGEFLFLLTPTTFLIEDISPLLERLENADVVAPLLVEPDGGIITSVRRIPSQRDFFFQLTGLSSIFKHSPFFNRWKFPEFNYNVEQFAPQPMSCALLMKREVFENAGGMDERFFVFFSDVDLFCGFERMGVRTIFTPVVKAVHIRGGITEKDPFKKLILFHRDMIKFFKKHYKYWHTLAVLSIFVFSIRILFLRIKEWFERN